MNISLFHTRSLENFTSSVITGVLGKNTSLQDVASNALLGIAAFFTSHQADKVLKNNLLPQDVKGKVLPWQEGALHSVIEQTCYSILLRAPSEFFTSQALNRILRVSRFCISFLLGATAARSLGVSSKALPGQFSSDILCGFCWAVCREGSLLALPKSISSSLLMFADGIVSSLVEACPLQGQLLSNNEWYYKSLSRGVFQIVAAGCTTFSGSSIPAYVQHLLFNLTRSV